MDEQEICNNCKKEIPQQNYVMHTMHCARNITLCKQCNEPIAKAHFTDHEKTCRPPKPRRPDPPTFLENSSYFQTRKGIEDKKTEARKERYMQRMDRLVDTGYTLNDNSSRYSPMSSSVSSSISPQTPTGYSRQGSYGPPSRFSNDPRVNRSRDNDFNFPTSVNVPEPRREPPAQPKPPTQSRPPQPPLASAAPLYTTPKSDNNSSGMLACKYCDLELPKLELDEHENYCGSRTDKCMECGELVMFKDKIAHMASNHSAAARSQNIGRNVRSLWDSDTQRSEIPAESSVRRPSPFRPLGSFDYDPMPYLPAAYQAPTAGGVKKKEGESYKEISRRLDCKTEYIRNLLHDSATITIPLRRNGMTPRNHFNHDKGPAPQPPYRRRNPPTELVIPCEFCGVPVPHDDLIEHETGCRPDLARFTPRTRARFSPERDDHLTGPSSPDVELPCEFCGDMIPASQLYSHQIRCN